jgi:hypothetical protein
MVASRTDRILTEHFKYPDRLGDGMFKPNLTASQARETSDEIFQHLKQVCIPHAVTTVSQTTARVLPREPVWDRTPQQLTLKMPSDTLCVYPSKPK